MHLSRSENHITISGQCGLMFTIQAYLLDGGTGMIAGTVLGIASLRDVSILEAMPSASQPQSHIQCSLVARDQRLDVLR
eukprot:1066493-Amphidinium_carterae.1